MRIAILGYGKMGKTIEQIALGRGHQISFKVNIDNLDDLYKIKRDNTDAVIEFTQPESAYSNLKYCIENNLPIVSGTTGWLSKKTEIEQLCQAHKGAFFYASNFSIGVNLFFQLNKQLARLMEPYQEYKASMEEVHHTEKKDAPSGTAITLAEGLMQNYPKKKEWINTSDETPEKLNIISKREANVPGTHTVFYSSEIDTIEITHTAHSRQGFATGAVVAAEWLKDKVGIYGMQDMLQLEG